MLDRFIEVGPGVLVATSRRDSTTTTVVVGSSGRDALLIDPAWEVDELESLADSLAARGLTVTGGFSTHAHFDHVLWHPRLGDAPRWASAETARRAASDRAAILEELGPWPGELVPLVGAVMAVPGDRLPWGGAELQLVVHDGHMPGHTAVWLPGPRILVAGDMLSDIEPPLPDDPGTLPPTSDPATPSVSAQPRADGRGGGPRTVAEAEREGLAAYAGGLAALEPFVRQAALVIPGHGAPGADGPARLARDRRHIDALAEGRDPHDERRPPA